MSWMSWRIPTVALGTGGNAGAAGGAFTGVMHSLTGIRFLETAALLHGRSIEASRWFIYQAASLSVPRFSSYDRCDFARRASVWRVRALGFVGLRTETLTTVPRLRPGLMSRMPPIMFER